MHNLNDITHLPHVNPFFLKKIRTYLRTCWAKFTGKHHLHKSLLRVTWKNLGFYTRGSTEELSELLLNIEGVWGNSVIPYNNITRK